MENKIHGFSTTNQYIYTLSLAIPTEAGFSPMFFFAQNEGRFNLSW